MSATPLFQIVDAVTIPVPDLDAGLRLYRDSLGHQLRWRHDDIGQARPGAARQRHRDRPDDPARDEPNWLVASADHAAAAVRAAGGRVATEPFDIPVGRIAVVADPFGNVLVLLDLSKGRYVTDTRKTSPGSAIADDAAAPLCRDRCLRQLPDGTENAVGAATRGCSKQSARAGAVTLPVWLA